MNAACTVRSNFARERTRELPADGMGNGDAAGRRRLLQADGKAYRGAETVIALHDHVGERDAEARRSSVSRIR